MASPSMVQRSGDTLIVRSVVSGDRLFLDPSECTSSETGTFTASYTEPTDSDSPMIDDYVEEPDKVDLPQCKIKRNYDCSECDYFTQNPRHFLAHLRDVHGEKVKIYYCPNCLYASRHFQKLLRHMKMVHGAYKAIDGSNNPSKRKTKDSPSPKESEDLKSEKQPEDRSSDKESKQPDEKPVVVVAKGKSPKPEMKCSVCEFTATSFTVLTRHERKEHLKTKYFPCSKCNYATHIKARYTKHVKYHSMPMIKCEVCDFRTPYKWNLDRHMKNHGGAGAFCCSACNFTADIKQSLTVHEMNHHVPAVGPGSVASGAGAGASAPVRRRNRVGATDTAQTSTTRPRRKRARPRITSQNASSQLQQEDFNAQNDISQINIVQNNFNRCDEYSDSKVAESKFNSCDQVMNDENGVLKMDWLGGEYNKDEDSLRKVPAKKAARPIPNLIPLHLQNCNQNSKSVNHNSAPLNLSLITKSALDINDSKSGFMSNKQFLESEKVDPHYNEDSLDQSQYDYLSTKSDESSQHSLPRVVKTITKKKNASIFDKLYKEKMTAAFENGSLSCSNCGQLSKSFSEHALHEKNCTSVDSKMNQLTIPSSGLSSTRCQNCRHRCKSSLDLIVHLQTCLLDNKNKESSSNICKDEKVDVSVQPMSEEDASVDDTQAPHPMENVVFVWNPVMNNMSMTAIDNFDNNLENNKLLTSTPNINNNNNNNINNNVNISTKEIENSNMGKKVFKCPHCSFWASTASRFHVHIVGHLNKKPFECSLCSYKSNWRWDITKHIRLKSVRDPDHAKAKVLMTDETGRRNYSKYNKYLTLMQNSDPPVDVASASLNLFNRKFKEYSGDTSALFVNSSTERTEILDENTSTSSSELRLQSSSLFEENKASVIEEKTQNKKSRKSMWKCKKCDYRNTSKDALLMHVRKHSKSSTNQLQQEESTDGADALEVINTSDSSVISYRCGHCNQVSNWKHVIQRHCRLKHNGDVKVVVGTKSTFMKNSHPLYNAPTIMKCSKCPYTATSKSLYESHLKRHSITSESIFKCFVCPYYVKTDTELMQHLPLHGITDPEKYSVQLFNCKAPVVESTPIKRYRCSDCPYESNSKSQFTYHEQFHKANDAPFKCDICNYQVSKRHLLHQHMKVHGFNSLHKDIIDATNSLIADTLSRTALDVAITCNNQNQDASDTLTQMWVSFSGEFQKMYKCRSCPFVNLRKNNIIDHEKLHNVNVEILPSNTQNLHKCSECNYVCYNLDAYLSHSKVHKDDYVKVFCPVNYLKTDEQQILELKEIMSEINSYKYKEDTATKESSDVEIKDESKKNIDTKQVNKCIYFCSDCPARFLFEKELQIHYKFHCIRLPYQCPICSYTARQHAHLLAHKNVHYEDYQEKTKVLQDMHTTHLEHPQPKIVAVATFINEPEPVWIVVADSTKKQAPMDDSINKSNSSLKQSRKQHFCHLCPAKIFKSSAFNYHLTLHGGQGTFKCRQCNYAVKTIGNLTKHEAVHVNPDMQIDYESGEETNYKNIPLSGTDLYHHKTKAEKRALTEKLVTRPNDHFPPVLQADPQFGLLIHGNPDFIYPTYLKNGRPKEKRYKCHKCPSAFEKREQYKVHLSLHGSKQRYKCELCDYSVKYYANYVQHMRKHQRNADGQAARQGIPRTSIADDFNLQSKSDTKLAIKSLTRNQNKDSSKLSISDQQTLKLLHRRRSSGNNSNKDATDERKIYRCTYCPYYNQRRDGLDNHMRRHTSVSGVTSNFTCNYCDYAAPQSQFLRDHMKVHFRLPKHINTESYTNFDGLNIFISKIGDTNSDSLSDNNKRCIFDINKCVDKTLINGNTENRIYVSTNNGEKVN